MKRTLILLFVTVMSSSLGGCVEEGHAPACGEGGRANYEAEGCLTPIGGSCLSEEEFKDGRPRERETSSGQTVTVEEDWESYQEERPHCFE